jgi:predicted small metal-binding protein
MKFQLACGDVMPGCPTSFSAASQEFTEVASHAAAEHGITDVTPEIAEAVTAKIRVVE